MGQAIIYLSSWSERERERERKRESERARERERERERGGGEDFVFYIMHNIYKNLQTIHINYLQYLISHLIRFWMLSSHDPRSSFRQGHITYMGCTKSTSDYLQLQISRLISEVKIPIIRQTTCLHASSSQSPVQWWRKKALEGTSTVDSLKGLGLAPLEYKTIHKSLLPEIKIQEAELLAMLPSLTYSFRSSCPEVNVIRPKTESGEETGTSTACDRMKSC